MKKKINKPRTNDAGNLRVITNNISEFSDCFVLLYFTMSGERIMTMRCRSGKDVDALAKALEVAAHRVNQGAFGELDQQEDND